MQRCWSSVLNGIPEKAALTSMKDGRSHTIDSEEEGEQTESHQKVPPTLRVELPTSNNLLLRMLHRKAQLLML